MSTPVMSLRTVGNWSDKIQIPLTNALSAATEICGWSGYKACEKAIVYMAKSAGKLTKVAPKLRPIVVNPVFKGKGGAARKRDMRRARYGVYKYDYLTGEKYFVPIYRGGEYGAAKKYLDRNTILVKVGGKWEKFDAGVYDEKNFTSPGLLQHRKRKIGRRGLAKDSWMWGLKGFHPKAIPNVTDVQPIISAIQCGLVLTNRVRYLSAITPNNLVDEVSRKATESIMFAAAQALEKKLGVEVPRLAAGRAAKAAKSLPQEFSKAEKAGTI